MSFKNERSVAGTVLDILNKNREHGNYERGGQAALAAKHMGRGTLERGMYVSDVLETESNSRRYVDDEINTFQPVLDICPIKDEVDSSVYYRIFSPDDINEIIKNLSSIQGV